MEILVSLIVTLIILAVFYWIVMSILGVISPPEPIGKIVQVLFLLICLVVFLRVLGIWGGGPYIFFHSRA